MKPRRGPEDPQPIAARTRSTSSKPSKPRARRADRSASKSSAAPRRSRRGTVVRIKSIESIESTYSLFSDGDEVDDDDDDDEDDDDGENAHDDDRDTEDEAAYHLRRSLRHVAPPQRFTFTDADDDADDESHDQSSDRSSDGSSDERDGPARDERREKSRLLKLLRRATDTDPDPLMNYLQTCDVAQCRHYHARHQELEAMTGAERPLRIQLYDHLPKMPPTDAAAVYARIRQIEEMDEFSADGAKLSGWARTVLSIPFGKYNVLHAPSGLGGVMAELDAVLYGQRAAKDAMIQAAAQLLACPTACPRVLALVGPPGVGKTTLGRGLGGAVGLMTEQISLGGEGDATRLKGHSMTYDGGQHGAMINALIRLQTMNPCLVLDEIDKMSSRHGNEVTGVLTHVLDATQSCDFVDDFVGFPVDLSRVLFIVTLNDLEKVDRILRDRLHVVHFAAPTVAEKAEIVARHMLPRLATNCGLAPGDVVMLADDVRHAVSRVAPEEGVRGLARAVESCVLRLNVLRMGGAALDVPYRTIQPTLPFRIDPAAFDALTKGDPEPDRPPPGMYM